MYQRSFCRIVFVISLLMFLAPGVQAQIRSSVAEGFIQDLSTDGKLSIRLIKIVNGALTTGIIHSHIHPSQINRLYPGLRRFRNQKWLFTFQSDQGDDSYVVISAYGMGSEDQKPGIDMPHPIFTTPEKKPLDHARATPHSYEQEVVELTNEQRWENGMLPPFKQVSELHTSSDGHSEDMGVDNFFAHCHLDDQTSPGDRMIAAYYYYNSAAENIAAGYNNPSSVISGWMNSSGHRANILSTSRREMGVGYELDNQDAGNVRRDQDGNCVGDGIIGPYYHYWTQNFGTRNSIYPVVIERELAVTSERSVNLYVYGPGSATSMRFSNNGTDWSEWFDYVPDHFWELSSGDGLKTVYSQVSTGMDGSGTVYNAQDEIELSGSCEPMVISNTTLNGTQTYTSCEIIADPNVIIDGEIIFQAGSVTLGINVEVPQNATLDIEIQ